MRTEKMNAAMKELLAGRTLTAVRLATGLMTYVAHGLRLEADGSLLFALTPDSVRQQRARFEDRVAYESFANKIQLDDWTDESDSTGAIHDKIAQALVLGDAVALAAEPLGVSLVVVVAADLATDDVVFRFHGNRGDEAPVLLRVY